MNAGLIILRVASERRDAQHERDGAALRISVATKRAVLGSDPQNIIMSLIYILIIDIRY